MCAILLLSYSLLRSPSLYPLWCYTVVTRRHKSPAAYVDREEKTTVKVDWVRRRVLLRITD